MDWPHAKGPVERDGRWDDPDSEFARLYVAATMSGALLETLRRFRRPPARLLRASRSIIGSDTRGTVPAAFLQQRRLGVALCEPDACFIDVCDPRTHNGLPESVRQVVSWFGVKDIDRSTMLSPDRRVTRYLARHFHEDCASRGLTHIRGLRFESRIGPGIECFALWDNPSPIDDESISVHHIELDHPALEHAVATLGLTVTR